MQLKGIADADFVGLASANRGSAMHRLLAQWAKFSRGLEPVRANRFYGIWRTGLCNAGKVIQNAQLAMPVLRSIANGYGAEAA